MLIEVQQFPLPLTAQLQVCTLHLQTLYVPTTPLIVKSIRPSPTIWTVEFSIAGQFLVLVSKVFDAALAVDTPTACRLVGMLSNKGADLTD
jgi:hypothetical protein